MKFELSEKDFCVITYLLSNVQEQFIDKKEATKCNTYLLNLIERLNNSFDESSGLFDVVYDDFLTNVDWDIKVVKRKNLK